MASSSTPSGQGASGSGTKRPASEELPARPIASVEPSGVKVEKKTNKVTPGDYQRGKLYLLKSDDSSTYIRPGVVDNSTVTYQMSFKGQEGFVTRGYLMHHLSEVRNYSARKLFVDGPAHIRRAHSYPEPSWDQLDNLIDDVFASVHWDGQKWVYSGQDVPDIEPGSTPELDWSFEESPEARHDSWKLIIAFTENFGNDTGRDSLAEVLREVSKSLHMMNTSSVVNAGGGSGPHYMYNLKGPNVSCREPDVLWTLRDTMAKIVLLLVEVKGGPLKKNDRSQLFEMMVGQLLFQYRVTGLLINSQCAEVWVCERQVPTRSTQSKGHINLHCIKTYNWVESPAVFKNMLHDIGEQSLYSHFKMLADVTHRC